MTRGVYLLAAIAAALLAWEAVAAWSNHHVATFGGTPCPVNAYHDAGGLPGGLVPADFLRRGLERLPRVDGVVYGRVTANSETRHVSNGVLTCTAGSAMVELTVTGAPREVLASLDVAMGRAGWKARSAGQLTLDGPYTQVDREYLRGRRERAFLYFGNVKKVESPPPPGGPNTGVESYTVFPAPCDGSYMCGYEPPPQLGT